MCFSASHTGDQRIVTAEVSDVKIGPAPLSILPKEDNFDAKALSTKWTAMNMGTGPKKDGAASKGNTRLLNNQLSIKNNGDYSDGNLDGIRYVYQVVAGDFDVAVQVVGFDPNLDGPTGANLDPTTGKGNPWEKGGIIFRQSLDADAVYVSSMISRGHGLRGQYRLEKGANQNHARRGDDGSGPKVGWWARLKRTGDIFEILCAETVNGPWLAPDDQLDRGLPNNTLKIIDPAYLGIFYTPHSTDNNTVTDGTGTFGNFVVFSGATSVDNWEIME